MYLDKYQILKRHMIFLVILFQSPLEEINVVSLQQFISYGT
jgi:hypothetical protein